MTTHSGSRSKMIELLFALYRTFVVIARALVSMHTDSFVLRSFTTHCLHFFRRYLPPKQRENLSKGRVFRQVLHSLIPKNSSPLMPKQQGAMSFDYIDFEKSIT